MFTAFGVIRLILEALEGIQMSLIYCPECGHEISDVAVACPSCGRPIKSVPVVKEVVPVVRERESKFPPWAFIPIAVVAGIVLLFFFFFMRSDDSSNVN